MRKMFSSCQTDNVRLKQGRKLSRCDERYAIALTEHADDRQVNVRWKEKPLFWDETSVLR